jgi:importin subunit beta-1
MEISLSETNIFEGLNRLFLQALNGNNIFRKQAEEEIENLYYNNSSQFFELLSNFITRNDLHTELDLSENSRLFAGALFRIYLKKGKWLECKYELRSSIKLNMLASLNSIQYQIRKTAVNIIASIASIELPKEWSEIFEILTSVIDEGKQPSQTLLQRETAVETLGYICEEVDNSILKTDYINTILETLVAALNKSLSNTEIGPNEMSFIIKCIKLYNILLPLSKNNFKIPNQAKVLLDVITSCVSFTHSYFISKNMIISFNTISEFIENVLLSIIILVENYYEILEKILNPISDFTFFTLNSNSLNSGIQFTDALRLKSLNIWCEIGDKENFLFNEQRHSISGQGKNFQIIKQCKSQLIEIMLDNIRKVSSEEIQSLLEQEHEERNWSIAKAAAYILCIIVQLTESSTLDTLLIYLERNYNSENEVNRHSALVVLGCCLESQFKEKLLEFLKINFKDLISTLSDSSKLVRVTASWLLCKITKLHPQIFEKSTLSTYIPMFSSFILNGIQVGESYKKENHISINLCNALINIIIFYGDKKTLKNSNFISPYYSRLIDICLKVGYELESFDNNFNLSYYCFQIISSIIEYSSQDYQDKLEELLQTFSNHFIQLFINNEIKTSSRINKQLEENLCLVMSQIFSKIIRKVKAELCVQIFISIINSFKKQGKIYEEGISCISNIATSNVLY